jgi:hypothetical protein
MIADDIKRYQRELGWSIIPVKKQDKVPYVSWAEYIDRHATEDEIDKWASKFPKMNIAVITGRTSGVVIIDIDTQEGKEHLKRYVPNDIVTPMCSTPSLGLHLYFKVPTVPITNSVRFLPGVDVRAERGYAIIPPSMGRSGVSYEWLPGMSPFDVPVADMPGPLLELLIPRMEVTPDGLFNRGHRMPEGDLLVSGRRDEDLFHAANVMIRGGAGYQETLDYLLILASRCDPPFDPNEARLKVESAVRRAMARERNIASEVNEWVGDTLGWFNVKDLYHQLGLGTQALQKIAKQALRAMIDEKVLEAHTSMNGMYRKTQSDVNIIKLDEIDNPYLDITWPFEIEQFVLTLPKSIAVVAGTPNSGKSAFLLNTARMNQDRFKVRYFSSEMGQAEIVTRVKKFGFPLSSWNVEFIERSDHFQDLILPDGFNVIDFLELHDNFFILGGEIKKIFDALNEGVAVIAIQKNPGAATGIGGYRGLEKPRLYMNMEPGKIEIVKGKNWTTEFENPNGLKTNFNLVNGCSFRQTSEWYR